MGKDDSEDAGHSMLPTFVSTAAVDGRPRLYAPDEDEPETRKNLEFTHTLMAVERPAGTMSVTSNDGLKNAPEPTDTLIDPRLSAPKVELRRWIGRGAMVTGVVAVLVAGVMLLTRSVALPPLESAKIAAPESAMAGHELAFLSRRWPAGTGGVQAVGAVPAPTPSRAPAPVATSAPRNKPSSPPQPQAAPVATTPAAAPVVEGPDATVNIVARRGNETPAAELFIDGRSVGQSPQRIALRPGRHTFEARSNTARASQTVDIPPGEVRRVVLELEVR